MRADRPKRAALTGKSRRTGAHELIARILLLKASRQSASFNSFGKIYDNLDRSHSACAAAAAQFTRPNLMS
jgi:hypothetical protein